MKIHALFADVNELRARLHDHWVLVIGDFDPPVPTQNLVDRAIVDVCGLGVKLAYRDASLAVRPARDREIAGAARAALQNLALRGRLPIVLRTASHRATHPSIEGWNRSGFIRGSACMGPTSMGGLL